MKINCGAQTLERPTMKWQIGDWSFLNGKCLLHLSLCSFGSLFSLLSNVCAIALWKFISWRRGYFEIKIPIIEKIKLPGFLDLESCTSHSWYYIQLCPGDMVEARPMCFFHDMLWSRVSSSGLLALEEVVSVLDIYNVLPHFFFNFIFNIGQCERKVEDMITENNFFIVSIFFFSISVVLHAISVRKVIIRLGNLALIAPFLYLLVFFSYQALDPEGEGDCRCQPQWILISFIECIWKWLPSTCKGRNLQTVSITLIRINGDFRGVLPIPS